MQLPRVRHPEGYAGLYVVDFGPACALGYTADEVAILLESGRFPEAKVYRIHRSSPDGTMELQGVARRRFAQETGLFFYQADGENARSDYNRLRLLAENHPLPCRTRLFLAVLPEPAELPYLTGLSYPDEFDPDVSAWLGRHKLALGRHADGGTARLAAVTAAAHIIESLPLSGLQAFPTRTREEVFASVDQPVQRMM